MLIIVVEVHVFAKKQRCLLDVDLTKVTKIHHITRNMSSLGTTSKQLDGLNATLVESRGKLASFRDAEPVATHETKKSLELLKSSCTKLKAETLAALLATIDKLVAKIDYKDPVSGTARYGDSARTKILSFQETVSLLQIELDEQLVEVGELLAITNKCLPTHDKVEEAITAAQGVATNIRGVPIVGPIASIDRFVDFKVTEQPHVATVTDTAHELGDHHVSELEEKARLVRERKATEAEHALRVQRMIQDTLEEIILHFNGIRNLQLARIAEKDSSNQLSGPIAIILQVRDVHMQRHRNTNIHCSVVCHNSRPAMLLRKR